VAVLDHYNRSAEYSHDTVVNTSHISKHRNMIRPHLHPHSENPRETNGCDSQTKNALVVIAIVVRVHVTHINRQINHQSINQQ